MEPIFLVVILIFSVVLHEVAHGFAAGLLGDPTARLAGRLTLNPISHLDWLGSVALPLLMILSGSGMIFGWAKPVPYNPFNLRGGRWGPAAVAAAGPLTNILLAMIFGLAARFLFSSSAAVASLLGTIVIINVVLAIFNLIPAPPLDGSKILFSLLPYRYQHWADAINAYSLIIILAVIFFLWPIVSRVAIGLSLLIAGPEAFAGAAVTFFN